MRAIVATAPEEIRAELRDLNVYRLLERTCSYRPARRTDIVGATKYALRQLALRVRALDCQMEEVDQLIEPLVRETAPELMACPGVGVDTGAALLVAAGDNPERLDSERCFANLCGVAPLDASSGKQERHRLNRSGDRQANAALWRIVMVRMTCDPRTRAYMARKTKEGATKPEAMRCLKRYVAREL